MYQTEHERLIAIAKFAKAQKVPSLPLIRAALARHIRLIVLHDPAQPWPAVQVALATGNPTVILVCDDPEPVRPSVGPHGWAGAKSLLGWPASAVIHGSGPASWHYEVAAETAQQVRRVVFIETATRYATAWADFLAVRCMIVTPPDGRMHPQLSHTTSASQ